MWVVTLLLQPFKVEVLVFPFSSLGFKNQNTVSDEVVTVRTLHSMQFKGGKQYQGRCSIGENNCHCTLVWHQKCAGKKTSSDSFQLHTRLLK